MGAVLGHGGSAAQQGLRACVGIFVWMCVQHCASGCAELSRGERHQAGGVRGTVGHQQWITRTSHGRGAEMWLASWGAGAVERPRCAGRGRIMVMIALL